ncbi:hypothetical protein Sinf_0786 [Streptococcus infantarius subsp. infantarius CJ18]|nr:hypothetical protein Sinf_0786 [Streptococcus infantarius subsp. infantarius CJ18]QBX25575.1 hypothetical protein Javan264_0027 [Streptococcus phage Javan264]
MATEEQTNPAVEPEQVSEEQASNPQETEKTVSIAEMQRRLKLAEEKHQMELAKTKTEIQKQIDDAVAKAKMSDEELQALKEKEKARSSPSYSRRKCNTKSSNRP